MSIAITGGFGFLGWHTACRLHALSSAEAVRLGRAAFDDFNTLADAIAGVDSVIHVAGVNRAPTDSVVERGNIDLACKLAEAIAAKDRPIHVVYANSVQADMDNPYGRGKAAAAEILGSAVREAGGTFADVLLPNLFGEHGRPHYNSFVATFVHEVAAGRSPSVTADREVPLLHVQQAAAALLERIGWSGRLTVEADPHRISAVLDQIEAVHALYSGRGEIPPLSTPFDVDLFNTYRAAAFPQMWPIRPDVHRDQRGALFESVRMHGGTGQFFVSTTHPGEMRGNHYHLRKVERFLVIRGSAEIQLRRLLCDDVVTFRVSGDEPAFVDMPTLWSHSIKNVGNTDLITAFWADQLLDPDNPDQYAEQVKTAR